MKSVRFTIKIFLESAEQGTIRSETTPGLRMFVMDGKGNTCMHTMVPSFIYFLARPPVETGFADWAAQHQNDSIGHPTLLCFLAT